MATGIGIFNRILPWLTEGQQVTPQVDQRGRLIVSSGDESVLYTTPVELDTNGGIVPTHKAHLYVYDGSNNLLTDTVTDAGFKWVRAYGSYTSGGPGTDSGWVKSNA